MITRAYYDKMIYFVNLTRLTPQDVEEMESAIRITFNPSYTVCRKCRAAIQHGQKMIRNWLQTQEVIEDIELMVDTEEPLFNMAIPEIIVDEVEADKVGCQKCRRKNKTKM